MVVVLGLVGVVAGGGGWGGGGVRGYGGGGGGCCTVEVVVATVVCKWQSYSLPVLFLSDHESHGWWSWR